MTYNPLHKRGFTLIETLVAVLLLATAITGPLTIASKGLTAALIAKDQIVAYFLAQDAIEYIRYKRDTVCLGSSPPCGEGVWLSTLNSCTSTNGTSKCYLDSTENSPAGGIATCGSNCPVLRYDSATNRYTYAPLSGTVKATIFTRTVQITNPYGGGSSCSPAGACEALIVVTVSWSDVAGITRSIITQENISNWQ